MTEPETVPSSLEAEYAVIGAVVMEPSLLNTLAFLSPSDFHSAPHADIWQAIQQLHSQGGSITPFTIMPLLKNPSAFLIDPHKYVGSAVTALTPAWPPIPTAKYLVQLAQRRELIHVCETVAGEAQKDNGVSVHDHAIRLNGMIDRLTENSPLNEFQDNYAVCEQIIHDLKDERRPFSTGLSKLDDAMGGGLYAGKSYGFAARKKVGKTALAATMSYNLNQAGAKHLFLAAEMSAKEIHQRVLSRATDSFPSAFRTSYGESATFGIKLAAAAVSMPKNTLYKNSPSLSFDELRRIASIAVEKYRVTGIILDYWQLVGGKRKNQSTAEHLDEVAQWIADFGRKHGIWTITMAQLNQDDNTRGSEGIRLAFDQVYQLHRPNLTQPDASLEMLETRYTPWQNVTGLWMNEKGPFFEQAR